LATKNGALAPSYTPATGVCANVYCHGASMPGGDTTGTNRTPTWNVAFLSATLSRAACASCHGFPPATTSGHPAVTLPATWPATGAATGALGTTCSCHANISTTGTTYANIFVNKALHIDGTLQVTGGHAVPYDTHKADVVAAGGNTTCLGCHAMGTAASPYPAAVVGNPPDCMSCHMKAAPLHTGTTAGANCSSCHGVSTATTANFGRPVGTAYPDRLGYHGGAQDGAHGTATCTVCHVGSGTTSGTNSGINHGKGSTAGPVRNGKPNVVGPMANGITPTNSAKGVGIPANGSTCVHGTINSGCSGGGTQTNRW
jgi:predicted CxxxxCH...CXXCH cytochrome family protein